jgi:hypothetical protein
LDYKGEKLMSLLVSTPTLSFEHLPAPPNLAVLEKPVQVLCGVVTFPDGKIFDQSQQATAGFFVYRQQAGVTEIWNETTKLWVADPGLALDSFKPKPLAYQPSQPSPWQGLLVPAIEKDTAFDNAAAYDYFIRTYFVSNPSTGSLNGLSPPSSLVKFANLIDSLRAGIKVPDRKKPEDIDEIQLFLRNPSLQIIGSVMIREDAGAARIEIANFDGSSPSTPRAVIRLLPTGDIEIQPAAGREVKIVGSVSVGSVFYQPANAAGNPVGVKRWLS